MIRYADSIRILVPNARGHAAIRQLCRVQAAELVILSGDIYPARTSRFNLPPRKISPISWIHRLLSVPGQSLDLPRGSICSPGYSLLRNYRLVFWWTSWSLIRDRPDVGHRLSTAQRPSGTKNGELN